MPTDIQITATKLARTLSEVLSRVRFGKDRFVVYRGKKAVARLEPVIHLNEVTLKELAASMSGIELPLGFADDLDEIQSSQPRAEIPQWPS